MRLLRPILTLCVTLLVMAMARPAFADATAFIGANTTPANRPVVGFGVGVSLLVVGVEFEYSATSEDAASAAPSLKTYMGNALLQTPGLIFGFQPYLTAGVGIFHEELAARASTDVGLNLGGGVKIGLAGPLRLRVDYRVFRLGSGALNSPAHRVYAGLNLAF